MNFFGKILDKIPQFQPKIAPPPHIGPVEKKVDAVADEAFGIEKKEPGAIKQWVFAQGAKIGVKIAPRALNPIQKEDREYLNHLCIEADEVIDAITEVAPKLTQVIESLLPEFLFKATENDNGKKQEIVQILLVHLVVNLAKASIEEDAGKISKETFVQKISDELIKTLLPLISELDKTLSQCVLEGKNPSDEIYHTIAKTLLEKYLPKEDSLGKLLHLLPDNDLYPPIGKLIKENIEPFNHWFFGGMLKLPPSIVDVRALQDDIEGLITFGSKAIATHYLEKDQAFLLELTGSNDTSGVVKALSPVFRPLILPMLPNDILHFTPGEKRKLEKAAMLTLGDLTQEALKKLGLVEGRIEEILKEKEKYLKGERYSKALDISLEALILRGVVSSAKEIFDDELRRGIQVEEGMVIQRVASHLSKILKDAFHEARRVDSESALKTPLLINLTEEEEKLLLKVIRPRVMDKIPIELLSINEEIIDKLSQEELFTLQELEDGDKLKEILKPDEIDAVLIARQNFILNGVSDEKKIKEPLKEVLSSYTMLAVKSLLPRKTYQSPGLKIDFQTAERLVTRYYEKRSQEEVDLAFRSFVFTPFSEELIQIFLPDDPSLKQLLLRHPIRFIEPVNTVIMSLFEGVSSVEKVDEYKNRLHALIPSEQTVEQIYSMIRIGALQAREGIKGIFQKDDLPELIKTWMAQMQASPMDDRLVENLSLSLNRLVDQEDLNIKWVGNEIELAIQLILFKGFVNLLEKVPEEKRGADHNILAEGVKLIFAAGSEKLNSVLSRFEEKKKSISLEVEKQCEGIKDPEKKQEQVSILTKEAEEKAAAELLAPFTDELLALFFNEASGEITLKDQLPLPPAYQKSGEKMIREQLALVFGKALQVSTTWIFEKNDNTKRLEALYNGSKKPAELCKLAGFLAEDGIAFWLKDPKNTIVHDELIPWVQQSLGYEINPKDERFSVLFDLVDGCLTSLGADKSKEVKDFLSLLNLTAETTLLRFLADASERLQKLEESKNKEGNESFLEEISLELIKHLKEHFKTIGKARDLLRKKGRKITDKSIQQQFKAQGKLHEALETEAKKDEFLKQLSEQLFKIIGVNDKEAFPVPDVLRDAVFQLAKETIVPAILSSALLELSDPDTTAPLIPEMLRGVKSEDTPRLWTFLSDHLFKSEGIPKEELERWKAKYSDTFQKDLEKELSELLVAIIRMQPDLLPRGISKIKGLREQAGAAMGQASREGLRDADGNPVLILSLLEAAFRQITLSVAPGEWKEDGTFTYFKTTMRGEIEIAPTGEKVEVERPNLERLFPETEEQAKEAERIENERLEQGYEDLPKLLKRLINDQTDRFLMDSFIQFWNRTEKAIMDWIDKVAGRYSEDVKRILRPILHFLVKVPMASATLLFNYTIWLLIKTGIKFFLNHQGNKRLKDASLKIHANLLYHILSNLIGGIAKKAEDVEVPDLG